MVCLVMSHSMTSVKIHDICVSVVYDTHVCSYLCVTKYTFRTYNKMFIEKKGEVYSALIKVSSCIYTWSKEKY